MAYAPPPTKLRLRWRNYNSSQAEEHHQQASHAPRRIVKRAAPRGANKRRRSIDDDLGRESDAEYSSSSDDNEAYTTTTQKPTTRTPGAAIQEPTPVHSDEVLPPAPSTPKRSRIAPEQLPLGLERSDFHDVHRQERGADEVDGSNEWTPEDDRMLVELVLEKLKLSKTEWQDCARNLGKDRHSLSRRWKSLMVNGDVGLKRNQPRRGKLHSTWR
jgi:hypothetical protein